MAYTTNPNLPYVRAEAIRLIQCGWGVRKTARHLGFAHNTILRWLKQPILYGYRTRLMIPTRSSRPLHHPHALDPMIVRRILELRQERNQCAEILHHRLMREGMTISISSVKRTLRRCGISRFSKWKKWHQYPPRPDAGKPGVLVEVDSMHDGPPEDRLSAYALIDVCSRWAYAAPSHRINSHASMRFVRKATSAAPFPFQTLQSDNGSEYSKWFTKIVEHNGLQHRHSRVRTPTDNAHVERFIQTLQRDCLNRIPKTFHSWQKEIPEYIRYYNTERPHMGLNYQTPLQVVTSY